MGRTKGKPLTAESWMMVNGKAGQIFYTHKQDKDITATASAYNRPVVTERMIAVSTAKKTPTATTIVKVTLL